MKKIFITTATAALLTVNVFAADGTKKSDDKATAEVSYATKSKFYNDFANAENVKWEVTSNFQKATFTLDDTKMTAFYNLRGEFMGVTQSILYKDLPSKAKKEIGAKYDGYFANDVIKLDNGDTGLDSTVYFVELKKDDKTVLLRVTSFGAVYLFEQAK